MTCNAPVTDWAALSRELDAWQESGRRASLWWRDDDAVEPSPALERLLDLARQAGAPLALAVIPARATWALAERLASSDARVSVLQHGFAHRNHAPPGAKKIEIDGARPRAEVMEELSRGRALLDGLFGETHHAILVPPWNRIAEALVPALPALGYRGLSAFQPRPTPRAAAGLVLVNTHVDLLRWRAPRGFAGESDVLGALVGHLAARRSGAVDPEEATGLLTHHLVHDAPAWTFLAELLQRLTRHPAVSFLAPETVFTAGPRDDPGATVRGAA